MKVKFFAVALLTVIGSTAVGWGASAASSAPKATSSVAVKTRKISGLGVVLVNAKGRTLYTFAPDQHRRVTCTGQCATYWPPLKWKGSSKPKAGGVCEDQAARLGQEPLGRSRRDLPPLAALRLLGDGREPARRTARTSSSTAASGTSSRRAAS